MAEIASFGVNVDQNTKLAQNAQSMADEANSGVTNLNDPNLMSVIEKQTAASQFAGLTSQYNVILARAKDANISTTALITAYTSLNTFMASILTDTTKASVVDRDTYKSLTDTYNSALSIVQSELSNSFNTDISNMNSSVSVASQAASSATIVASQAATTGNNASQVASQAIGVANEAKSAGDNAVGVANNASQAASSAILAGSTATVSANKASSDYQTLSAGVKDGSVVHITTETVIDKGVIGTAEIANGAITNAQIGNEAVGTAQIGGLAVGTAQIGDGAITNAKIGSLAVGTAQIANAAITDAKVGDLSANKLTAGTIDFNTITGTNINASNITTGKLDTDRLNVNKLSALSANLGDVTTGSLKGVDIVANTFSTPNGSFTTDVNGAITAKNMTLIGGTLTSPTINASTINGSTINGTTINTPTLNLGLNGTFTESYDYTQPTSRFLPKKNKGTLTFNHGVLQSRGNMQTYASGHWGGINDGLVFKPGMNNAQWTEIAPGYIKLDLCKQNGTDVAERTYTDPTGYHYTDSTGVASYFGNVLQTPQVQTAGVLTQYIGPSRGALRLQIGQNGKDYGLQVGSYAGNEAVLSDFIYNSTVSKSPNVWISENGHLMRTTSASKYKYNIKNPDIETTLGDRLLNVHMATWNDKRAVDLYAEQLNTGEEREKISIDKYYGLIAEQLRDAGLDMFISYGKNHEIEGVQYDRAWVPLLSVIRRLNDKVNEYELRLSKLEAKINE